MNPTTITITMPWPPKGLSPNVNLHFRPKAILKKAYRAIGLARATDAMRGLEPILCTGVLPVKVTFFPPDRRHRDDDNMVGALKSGRDGIADALGVNDRRFRCSYTVGEPCKGGAVLVEICPAVATQSQQCQFGDTTTPEWLTALVAHPRAE